MGTNAALRRKAPDAREAEIIAALQSNAVSLKQRRKLLWDLGARPTARSLEVLRENLCSSDARVSVGALLALRRLGSEEAWDAVIECLAMDRSPRLGLAVDMLGKENARKAIPALVECLERRRNELRRGDRRLVAMAFIRMPHRSEVPALARTLRERRPRLRKSAALALMQIRAPESLAALETAASEFSWLRGRTIRHAVRQRRRMDALG